jgi:hypothetical protein
MSAFTPEQQEILLAIANCLQTIAKNYAVEVEQRLASHIKAVTNVLVEKNVCDAEDIRQALRAVEADVEILTALDPEIQAALDKLNDIMRKFREEN